MSKGWHKYTQEEVLRMFRKTHGEKYDYSLVDYKSSKDKVYIICPKHGGFYQQPSMHIIGRGCPKCGRVPKNKENATNDFIEKAKAIHGTTYGYENARFINNRTKVLITCSIHGEFEQIPQSHLKGCGCPKCAIDGQKKDAQQFIDEARQRHGDKYDYSKTIYTDCRDKICITCPIHGEFWQQASAHLRGQECPKCSHQRMADNKRTPINIMLKEFYEVHQDRYDYSLIDENTYNGYKKVVPIICRTHGVFYQKPINHILGYGCHKCRERLGEKRIGDFLKKHGVAYIQQYKIPNEDLFCSNKKMFVDFYIPNKNVFIEFNGAQHYKPVSYFGGQSTFERQQARDISIRQYCKTHHITLIEIPYTKYECIEDILKTRLKL